MTQNGNIYTADEGNFIVRIADELIMGEQIDLGTSDSIDNYKEQPYTEESYNEFYHLNTNPIDEPEESEEEGGVNLLLGKSNKSEEDNVFLNPLRELFEALKQRLQSNAAVSESTNEKTKIEQEP